MTAVVTAVGRAVGLTIVASTVVAGIPLALIVLVGNPLPASMPSLDGIWFAVRTGQIAPRVWVDVLAIVAWLAWARIMVDFVSGAAAAMRGRTPVAHRWGPHRLASGVVGQWALVISLLSSPSTAVALPVHDPVALATVVVDESTADASATDAATDPVADPGRAGPTEIGVTVGRRDTLWSLAETHLGDGARWIEIRDRNAGQTMTDGTVLSSDATRIRTGWHLIVPTADARPSAPGSLPPAVDEVAVEVEPGDNVWRLGRERLLTVSPAPTEGDVAAYVDAVIDRNGDVIDDPDLIFPGEIVVLPGVTSDGSGPGVVQSAPAPDGPAGVDEGAGTGAADRSGEGRTWSWTPPDGPTPTANDGDAMASTTAAAPIHGDVAADTAAGGGAVVDGAPLGPTGPEPVAAPVASGAEPAAAPPASTAAISTTDLSARSAAEPGRGELAPVVVFGLGAASGLLAAGALSGVGRLRRYRLAHRGPGRVPADPAPGLEGIERSLRHAADEEQARWLAAAVASLGARPVWDGERVAQPILFHDVEDHLEVEFDLADPVAAPLPWASPDGGRTWHLPRSTPVEELGDPPDGPSTVPALVTVGTGVLVNLEAVGVLEVEGDGPGVRSLARSMIHELACGPSGGQIDIRLVTGDDGPASFPLVQARRVEDVADELEGWVADTARQFARAAGATAYRHRLVAGHVPLGPVVLFVDRAAAEVLAPVVSAAADAVLPLAVVILGENGSSTPPWGARVRIDGDRATIEPWDLEFEPQLLGPEAAAAVDALRIDAASGPEQPLLTGLQLSASASELRRWRGGAGPVSATADTDGRPDDSNGASLMVRVLGPVDVVGAEVDLTSQQLSLVAYVACNPGRTRDAIVDALWDGQAISSSRFPNLVTETRSRLGRDRFPEARDGRYFLQGVSTDLEHFEQALGRLRTEQQPDVAAAELRRALALVRGEPFAAPGRRFWTWTGDHSHVSARVEAMVADAAARLARLEMAGGRHDEARWACEQGLLAAPTDATLVADLAEIYDALGKPATARRLVERWEDQISRLDCGEPSDEPRRRLAG